MTFSGAASAEVYADILTAVRFFNPNNDDTLNYNVTVTDAAGQASAPQAIAIYFDN
jgi:hypothetical protein